MIGWHDPLVVDIDQVSNNSIRDFLCEVDLIGVVVNSDGLRAGKTIWRVTPVVINGNTEVVFGHDFFDQHIGTVSLEAIVCSIKCEIVGISPTRTDALTLVLIAAPILIINLDWRIVVLTNNGLSRFTIDILVSHISIIACCVGTLVMFPNFIILSWWV